MHLHLQVHMHASVCLRSESMHACTHVRMHIRKCTCFCVCFCRWMQQWSQPRTPLCLPRSGCGATCTRIPRTAPSGTSLGATSPPTTALTTRSEHSLSLFCMVCLFPLLRYSFTLFLHNARNALVLLPCVFSPQTKWGVDNGGY
ncbi:hypothetical protein DUNSADRAFT_7214 [Dunaliella salina]|uniref:Encoded protein n=1 Tax=Dunaliella salina TaxID=3046 RepID=A0ABQ7GLZ7_DUNSA|nr:hypothetical protein DUNSADRAFT_7214 [Dunaliella salina]|eukprot:KAF5835561.1 hypothetical protein DUNSADRAFT_7214 [Dunaliella salina]